MKSNKNFSTIDGETLMSLPLESAKVVVSGLLHAGLHILAGAPKIGKSWLALWLCLQIAKGGEVWNLKTEQGTVLYLCLEDSFSRIQNRLLDITDDAPPDIHFATMANILGEGLEQQIETFIAENKNTNLIVIDTLQKIRGQSNNSNPYANDYREINILKSLADKHKIAILLIHHLRKTNDDDPMNMISGTTGITGVVDSSFVLAKDKRSSRNAKLICDGRDIEYRELELSFNKQNHIWELISDSMENPEVLLDEIIFIVSDFIREHKSFTGTPSELAEKLQKHSDEKIIPNILSKKLLQNTAELEQMGISYQAKRSNGKRFISLSYTENSVSSDDSDGKTDMLLYPKFTDPVDPVDPAVTEPQNEASVAHTCRSIGTSRIV